MSANACELYLQLLDAHRVVVARILSQDLASLAPLSSEELADLYGDSMVGTALASGLHDLGRLRYGLWRALGVDLNGVEHPLPDDELINRVRDLAEGIAPETQIPEQRRRNDDRTESM